MPLLLHSLGYCSALTKLLTAISVLIGRDVRTMDPSLDPSNSAKSVNRPSVCDIDTPPQGRPSDAHGNSNKAWTDGM